MEIGDARTITAVEAEQYGIVKAGTLRGWATRELLACVGIGPDGQRWYLLERVLTLAEKHRTRASYDRTRAQGRAPRLRVGGQDIRAEAR